MDDLIVSHQNNCMFTYFLVPLLHDLFNINLGFGTGPPKPAVRPNGRNRIELVTTG